MITLENVTGGYNASTAIVQNLSFTVDTGQFFALLGPNGSGKTTIIRLIMGALNLHSGIISIADKEVKDYKPRELAQKVAVMTQENEVGLEFTVKEIVSLGRYPYQKSLFFKENTFKDDEVVEQVMKQTNVWEFRNKSFVNLSGGEKQRVLLAKALAQEPELLLLDEPTNHLDIRHTMELLDLLKHLQKESKLTILAILHDLNIASLYADKMGLLNHGKLQGTYDGLLEEKEYDFSEVYQVHMNFHSHPEVAKNQIFVSPKFLVKSKVNGIHPHLVVQDYQESTIIKFPQPLRTISLGTYGKGLSWEDSWTYRKTMLTNENDNGSLLFDGEVVTYAFNTETKDYEEWNINDEIKSSWSSILLMFRNDCETQIAFVTNTSLNDVQLMNTAMQLTALKSEQDILKGKLNGWEKPLSLLTISTCDIEERSSEEQSMVELVRLYRYALNKVNRLDEVRK